MEEDYYKVDFTKVVDFEDLKAVLSALEFVVPSGYAKRADIQQYLVLVEK